MRWYNASDMIEININPYEPPKPVDAPPKARPRMSIYSWIKWIAVSIWGAPIVIFNLTELFNLAHMRPLMAQWPLVTRVALWLWAACFLIAVVCAVVEGIISWHKRGWWLY